MGFTNDIQKYDNSLRKILEDAFGIFWPLVLAFILGVAVHKILQRLDQVEHLSLNYNSDRQNSLERINDVIQNKFNSFESNVIESSLATFTDLPENNIYNFIYETSLNLSKFDDSGTESLHDAVLSRDCKNILINNSSYINFNPNTINFIYDNNNIENTITGVKEKSCHLCYLNNKIHGFDFENI